MVLRKPGSKRFGKNGRDYLKEAKWASSPLQKKNRAERNRANNAAKAAGLIKKGDGNHVDHGTMSKGKGGKTQPIGGKKSVISAAKNLRKQPKRS